MTWIYQYRTVGICVMATALMAFVFAFLHIPTNYLPKDTIVLSPGQVFPDAKKGEENIVSFTVTEDMANNFADGSYYFFHEINHQISKIYYHNEFFKEYRMANDQRLDSLVLFPYEAVELSSETALGSSSRYNRYFKTTYPVYLGHHRYVYNAYKMVSTVKLAFLWFMVVSFIAILLYVPLYLRRIEFIRHYTPIALFFLFSGVYVAIDTYSVGSLINDTPYGAAKPVLPISFSFWMYFTLYLIPLPLFLFAIPQAKRIARKLLAVTAGYSALLLIIGMVLDTTGIMFLPDLGDYFGWGLVASSAALLYWSFTRCERGGWVYPYFFALMLIASIFDFTCFKLRLPVEDYRLLKSFLMVTCMIWAVETLHRMVSTHLQILSKREREITEAVTAIVLENYNQLDSHVQQMRKIKHDLINHYQSVFLLYRQNEHEKALQYLKKLSETAAEATSHRFQNILVDSIIYNKLTQSQGICVVTEITVPSELPYEDNDVCSLLVNILDNALESCVLCQEPELTLKIFTANNQMFVYCKNSKSHTIPVKNGKIQTSKAQRQGHGFGLSIINGVAEKYGGTLLVNYDDESFTLNVAIPL